MRPISRRTTIRPAANFAARASARSDSWRAAARSPSPSPLPQGEGEFILCRSLEMCACRSAKAGVQGKQRLRLPWIPAFARMTPKGK